MTTKHPGVRGLAALALAGLALAVTGCGPAAGPDDGAGPAAPASTSTPTPSPAPSRSSGLPLGKVVLDSPDERTDVKQCGIFTGRANLPDDKTIVLGVRNTDNGSPERYFEAVDHWEYPSDLQNWKAIQWFGDKDSSAGQHFRVEVLVVDLALATKKMAAAKTEGWHGAANPPGAKVAAHRDLHRVKGKGPAECY